jgi:hypothetical protein
MRRRRRPRREPAVLATREASLLELVDQVLNRGVVLTGEVVLGLANVDLVYLRLSALLCAADQILGGGRRRAGRGAAGPPDEQALPLRRAR